MPAGIEITNANHTAEEIRELAWKCKNRSEARRLRAIARVMEGEENRAEIARRAKVDRQTLCDWVNRYNAMGLVGLKDKPGRGRPSKLSDAQRAEGSWAKLTSNPSRRPGVSQIGCNAETVGYLCLLRTG